MTSTFKYKYKLVDNIEGISTSPLQFDGTTFYWIGTMACIARRQPSEQLHWRDFGGTVRFITCSDGSMYARHGYAWDGCSPKLFYGSKQPDGSHASIGTWDGNVTKRSNPYTSAFLASLRHDILYQFREALTYYSVDNSFIKEISATDIWTRKEADDYFRETLKMHKHGLSISVPFTLNVPLHNAYWLAVRLLGGTWAVVAESISMRGKNVRRK